jgi:hypothetical protein
MFTTVDKAVVALIMAAIFLVNNFTGWHLGLSEDTVNAVAGVLAPLLVWLVPNRTTS